MKKLRCWIMHRTWWRVGFGDAEAGYQRNSCTYCGRSWVSGFRYR